jgi:23S rRNA pseudouridine1911/1915/1917 synthase
VQFEVKESGRLDRAVGAAAGVSRREARLLLGSGRIRVDNRAVRIVSREVRAGQKIEVDPRPRAQVAALEVLFRDPEVAIVVKPAGLLSEPDRFGAPAVTDYFPAGVHLVHRLDAHTSGLLALAFTARAARRLGEQLQSRTAKKTYLALVCGRLERAQEINAPVGRVLGTRHGVVAGGRPALTRVRPLEHGEGWTLVEAAPVTGRTHQIRVHLQSIGHPVLGDALYGGRRYLAREPVLRTMLHAASLTLLHPRTGRSRTWDCPPPADFLAALARARGLHSSRGP